jgi:4-oxalocrotonate tautomerase
VGFIPRGLLRLLSNDYCQVSRPLATGVLIFYPSFGPIGPNISTTTHEKENTMPLVQIKGISEFLTLDQKQEVIKKVTDAIVSVEGEGIRPVTWVIIEDVKSGEWGIGGDPVTTEKVRELATAKQ